MFLAHINNWVDALKSQEKHSKISQKHQF